MDLKSRLRKVERDYIFKQDLFPEKPDFENWSDEEIFKHIKDSIERTHKEQNIKSYAEGVAYYDSLCNRELISEDEKRLFLKMDKEYWEGKFV